MKQKNILFLLFLLFSVNIHAIDFHVDGIYYSAYTTSAPYTAIVVPGTIKYKGDIKIPETVDYNGITYTVNWLSNAFYECTELTSVSFPKTLKIIGSNTFARCTSLTSISIPEGITDLFEGTFWYCSALKNVELPTTLKYLGDRVFEGCKSLNAIKIPTSVTKIDDDVFAYCEGLTDITIPNSVTELGWNVFYGCKNLKTVNIGTSVAAIGWYTFSYCSSLTEINVITNNKTFSSKDGVLFSKDMTTLINCPNGLTGEYIMPGSVKEIRNFAFAGCINLTSLVMNENLNWILDDAFVGCSNLATVTLPNTLYHIGYDAFGECTSLKSITIPDSVFKIGNCCFQGCTKLMAIHMKSPVPCVLDETYPDTFRGLNTNTCVLYVPVGSKDAYRNAPQWWYFVNIVEETTGLPTIEPSDANFYITDNQLVFKNIQPGELIQVYTLDGKLVFHSNNVQENTIIQLPKNNIFIVKTGMKTRKVVLLIRRFR